MASVDCVNTTDLVDAIRLGCRTMQSVFNADDHDVPFFKSRVRPRASREFYSPFTEAHVPGRHLNARLNAEEAIGVWVDEGAIEKHRRAALLSFSGPLVGRDIVVAFPLKEEMLALSTRVHAHEIRVKLRGDEVAAMDGLGADLAYFPPC